MTAWHDIGRVLCVRLDSMGDVLMTGPAIRAIKQSPGKPQISLLTSRSGAEAAALMPEIDETVVYAAPWMKPAPPNPSPEGEIGFLESLRARSFDAAVIFTVFSQSALPAAL